MSNLRHILQSVLVSIPYFPFSLLIAFHISFHLFQIYRIYFTQITRMRLRDVKDGLRFKWKPVMFSEFVNFVWFELFYFTHFLGFLEALASRSPDSWYGWPWNLVQPFVVLLNHSGFHLSISVFYIWFPSFLPRSIVYILLPEAHPWSAHIKIAHRFSAFSSIQNENGLHKTIIDIWFADFSLLLNHWRVME